jgi:hypothetical protein
MKTPYISDALLNAPSFLDTSDRSAVIQSVILCAQFAGVDFDSCEANKLSTEELLVKQREFESLILA